MSEKPRWGFFDLILVYLVSLFLTTWLVSRSRNFLHGWMSSSGRTIGTVQDFLLSYLVQFLIFSGMVLLVALVLRRAHPGELGIKGTSRKNWLKYGLAGGVLAFTFAWAAGLVIERLHPDVSQQGVETVLRSVGSPGQFILLLLVVAVLAPLTEELFYRGMVYPVFRAYIGKTWGMVAAGSIFGLVHMDLWRAIPLAVGGIFLCYVYEKTGSILVCTLTHGIWNGILALLIYLSMG
ncbi:MAG: type II CAAX endopeptidase family protein [Syntrophomonas sp.]